MISVNTPPVQVAGRSIVDPTAELVAYGQRHHSTIDRYDLSGAGEPDSLTLVEVARTRVIASRISHAEAAWFVEHARSAPWRDVPLDADLASADPADTDGLYDAASRLYEHFRATAPSGISTAKLHKVLHLKRPALFPILDSHLLAVYRDMATVAAGHYVERRARRMYWAAVREDLLRDENQRALAIARATLSAWSTSDASGDARVRAMASLTDLRLLDAVAWRSFAG